MVKEPFPIALTYDDVLVVPQKSNIKSRSEIDLSTSISKGLELSIPLISMSMDTVTGVEMAVAMHKYGGIGFLPRFDTPEIEADKVKKIKDKKAKVVAAIGLRDNYLKRAELQIKAGADGITLDIAHAHTSSALDAISKFKNRFQKIPMFAGTIATYEGAYDLFKAGADAVRIGVGAGTICTTRIVAGSGVPQITAIMDAVKAKKKFKNRYILADGGAVKAGDLVKALAAGADACMCGSLFAGTDEAPGEMIKKNGNLYKKYNASTSKTEKGSQFKKYKDGIQNHFNLHIEGVEALVRYKGSVGEVLDQLCAGLRSGLSYSGAQNIKEFQRKAKFIRITPAGLRESFPHDVRVVGKIYL